MRAYGPGKGCGRLSLIMLLFLAGCGGGGGGGGGGGLPALMYTGSTSQAAVTTLNASRLSANIFGSNTAVGIISGTSTEGGAPAPSATGMEGVTRTLNHATRRALASASASGRRAVASGVAVPFDETLPCDLGMGTVRTNGTLDNMTLTGSFTVTFNNCLAAGLTLNGSLAVQVLAANPAFCGGIPTNFTANTSRITIRGSGVSMDAGGSLHVLTSISFPTATETIINNLVNLNNLTGVMTMGQNLVSVGTQNSVCSPTSISNLTFNGRIFDNVHGYTDVSTIAPLQINLPQPFPTTGEIRLAGNASALHVTALSPTRVQLQFDTNADNAGDGFAALMNWTDLTGPVGADIGNSDADQMHNSWETFYSMNPNVAGDDILDNDSADGNNLAEYQNGTNPNVAGM